MAAWPTSVATDTELYLAKNNVYSSLNGAINSAVTSLVLTDASAFPDSGAISIDNEVIFYASKSTNTLNSLTRGADGTTAASHTDGRIAMHRIIAAHHNSLKDEIIAVENSLNLTASRLIVTNGSGRLAVSAVTATEAGYLSGVTSAIQTQLGTKITAGAAAIVNADVHASAAIAVSKLAALTASRALVSDGSGFLAVATTTATELGYVNGVTSAIQTQLDARLSKTGGTMSGAIAMGASKITGLANGTASTDAAAFGQIKIIQVVTGTSTTAFTTTSASFVASNLSAAITPTSSSNKVFVLVSGTLLNTGGGATTHATIARGGSNLLGSDGQVSARGEAAAIKTPCTLTYMDSPASTSALTYAVYIKASGNTGGFGEANQTQHITLIEVAS